jgi:8-amino-3,8-dideoxy-alpha-D-manno-octulosonate transaminase
MPGFELIGEEESRSVKRVFDKGGILFRHSFDHLRNGTYMVRDFEDAFAKRMQSPRALAVTSGTAALRVALASLGIKEGDEVITQSFTFVATVEAIIESRATPVCCEIDATLNMDPADLVNKITPKTKAIIVVHMLGVPARLEEIVVIANKHNIPIIEDTAWGCGGSLNDRPLGTWGEIGTFSFDFAKTMTTGEGGMLLFNNDAIADRAAAWHDHGHENNPDFPRWEDTRSSSGFNYRMMELQGAVGLAQLEKLDFVVTRQRENAEAIRNALGELPIQFRESPPGSYETADALIFFVENREIALRCRNQLVADGLGTKILPEAYGWHFAGTWNHMKELVAANGGDLELAFPQSMQWINRAVSLPITVKMDEDVPGRIRLALEKSLAI